MWCSSPRHGSSSGDLSLSKEDVNMTHRSSSLLLGLLALLFLSSCETSPKPSVPGREDALVVFLVRHGERADKSVDAALSAVGVERAALLARTLRDAEIEYVHSSDYTRTRDTAVPTAQQAQLDVELYDPRDLPALVEKLQRLGGRHLVVGHSNTTPQMARLLGGEAGPPMKHDEHDRLYQVTIDSAGSASTVVLRFGQCED